MTLTPAQEKKLAAAASKFRRQMEKLGVGVSISVGDGPMVEVVPDPRCVCAETSARNCPVHQHDGPSDDEIYNRPGVEGGIVYTDDEPGSLGENDGRL